MRKYLLLIVMLLVGLNLFARKHKAVARGQYNYKAQKRFIPKPLKGIYIGISHDDLQKIVDPSTLEYGIDVMSEATLKHAYMIGDNRENFASVTYFFVRADTTTDANTIPAENKLFKIAIEFQKVADADAFLLGWRRNKRNKIITYFEWHFTSPDGMECRVAASGLYLTMVGNIPGTPWKEECELLDAKVNAQTH